MLIRICGKCFCLLNKENATRLHDLQPNCDSCPTQDQLNFEKILTEKWKSHELLEIE
jgi:hypothetical protein